MGATYRTTGLVLGRTNFGEADRIITLITPDHGKIKVVARGVRRIKSRLGGHLEPFGFVDLMCAVGRGNLDVVTSARLTTYYPQVMTDYSRLGLAHMMALLLGGLTSEGQAQPEVYLLAREAYEALATTNQLVLLELYVKLNLLGTIGYRPDMTGCVVCGEAGADARYRLSPESGGLTCAICDFGGVAMDTPTIKLWRLVLERSFAVVGAIQGAGAAAEGSLAACDDFYGYHFGRAFRPTLVLEPLA